MEKPGTRVEIAEWPTTLVLESSADEGQAAVIVDRQTKKVTRLRREGARWSVELPAINNEMDVLVYRTDERNPGTAPNEWTATLGGQSFRIARTDRSHQASILLVLYIRNGRNMLKISGEGYAFGIDGYARSVGMAHEFFRFKQAARPSPSDAAQDSEVSPAPHALEGQGSGVAVGPGLVITNHHVVSGVERLVVAHEGRRSDAHVVLSDAGHDIALVRHDLIDLTPIAMRDPAESHLGEEIMAAGYPLSQVLGDDLKLTYGNVSGLKGGGDITCLQFTAAIASGSSGGALLDMSGRLVGLVSAALRHTAFSERGAASENINFAVKASLAREMMVAAGKTVDPYVDENVRTRAVLASIARGSVVSIDCYRRT